MTKQTAIHEVDNVPFARRVLLLPHCLRPSQDCPGKMTKQGLDCSGCARVDCAISFPTTATVADRVAGELQ